MRIWLKFSLLLSAIIFTIAICIALAMRWVVIDVVQQQSLSSKEIIARTLADHIANAVLTNDQYTTSEALIDAMWVNPDIEYIYVTSLDGRIFAHTFAGGVPLDILQWNPLHGREQSIQLLDTEKGFINDVGVSMFGGANAQIHLGIWNSGLKKKLAHTRNAIFLFTAVVTVIGIIASFVFCRAITQPLQKLVVFSQHLARGEFGTTIPHNAKDEMGMLIDAFNMLSHELTQYRKQTEKAHHQMCITEKLNAMSRLSAGLAHELRNPLTAIKILFNTVSSPQEITLQDMSMVRAEISHMDGILKRFLSVSRNDALDIQEVNINELLGEVALLLRVPMKKQKIDFFFDPGEIPLLVGNKPILEQAFLNLFINAIEAMPDGGSISVRTQSDGKSLTVTIQDTGHGIPQHLLDQIFDPFITTKPEGTGLGLFLVKSTISKHKGSIDCQGTERGTRFTIILPLKQHGWSKPVDPTEHESPAITPGLPGEIGDFHKKSAEIHV